LTYLHRLYTGDPAFFSLALAPIPTYLGVVG
jgi:hypothetical protein